MRDWPGQTVLCVTQLYWTLEIHKAIKGGAQVSFIYFVPVVKDLVSKSTLK